MLPGQVTHGQWFYFRVSGAKGKKLVLHIVNAGKASFPEAWPGYCTAASYDHEYWFRVPTGYDKDAGVLTFGHTCERVSKAQTSCCDALRTESAATQHAATHSTKSTATQHVRECCIVAGLGVLCVFCALHVRSAPATHCQAARGGRT